MTAAELGARMIQISVIGPALAAVLWLLLAPWVWPRRLVAGVVALVSHAAVWGVFWLAYLDEGPAWRSLAPSLLTATVVAVAGLGVLMAAVRLERRAAVAPVMVVAVGVSATALVLAGYTGSLVVLAVVLPVPTLALLASSLVDPSARRGLIGLGAADVLALAGLSVVFDRTDTAAIAASTGLGIGLLLAAAAVKAGAVAGVGTARLGEGGSRRAEPGPDVEPEPEGVSPPGWGIAGPSVMGAALRGHGVLLAAIAAAVMAGGEEMLPAAVAGAVAATVAGLVAALARAPGAIRSAAIGAAAAVAFVALGLGGGFGIRAFLVLFPAFLLAAAAVELLGSDDGLRPRMEGRSHRLARATGALALGVALGSLAGVPPGGGFPGTWMTASLAGARGVAAPAYFLLVAAVLTGLALALAGGIRLLRLVRPGLASLMVGVPAALVLLYMGAQPVRLGLGWWIRIEEALGLPTVLPSAGGPTLQAVGGRNLALALAPGVLLALLTVVAGRGLRVGPPPVAAPLPGWPLRDRVAASGRLPGAAGLVRFLRRPVVWLAAAIVLEAAAAVLAVRLLILAASGGFL